MSLVSLKLVSTLIKECGVVSFIRENLRVTQKLTRTSDNDPNFSTKYRLMLEVSPEMRQ